ncbi:MAG: DUF4199 domain-containing protein [Chitinophagaceae bacterium]|jgi:Protein of unknown function (DUF4199)
MPKTHIQKGLLIAACIILVDIVLHLTKYKLANWSDYPARGVLFVGIIAACLVFAKQQTTITFSQLVGYGFKVATVVVCVLFLYTALSIYMVFPNYIDALFTQSIEEAKKQVGFSMQEVEKNAVIAKKVIGISILSGMVLLNLAIGLVAAVIAAIVFQKNK